MKTEHDLLIDCAMLVKRLASAAPKYLRDDAQTFLRRYNIEGTPLRITNWDMQEPHYPRIVSELRKELEEARKLLQSLVDRMATLAALRHIPKIDEREFVAAEEFLARTGGTKGE